MYFGEKLDVIMKQHLSFTSFNLKRLKDNYVEVHYACILRWSIVPEHNQECAC